MSEAFADVSQPIQGLPLVQLKVYVPRPVEIGIEDLVLDVMQRSAPLGNVARGDLVGALVRRAVEVREELPELVASYRDARVREFLPNDRRQRGRVEFPPRPRGRRSR